MNIELLALIAIIITLAVILLRKKRKAIQKYPPPPQSGWWFRLCKGMPDAPTMQGEGFTFDFPTDPGNNVNAVLNFDRRNLRLGQTITALCNVTGGPFVPWESEKSPALVSFFIQRRGDNMTGKGKYVSYRWYSDPQPLRAGPLKLSTVLAAENFINVAGQRDPEGFAAALADMESIGIVFGWEAGRAHGVYAAQPSTFTLESIG